VDGWNKNLFNDVYRISINNEKYLEYYEIHEDEQVMNIHLHANKPAAKVCHSNF
jgi:hypothetical protein